MMPFKQFTQQFIAICLGAMIFVATINLLIDPFNIYRTPLISGINLIKTEIDKHERLYKAIDIAREKPQALLLGSSRIVAGFDPQDLTEITGIDAYNGGFQGASFSEIYHYFEHALHHQPQLKIVVIGLDFSAFSTNANYQADFKSERLKNHVIHMDDIFSSLFSFHSLKSSFETFKHNWFKPYLLPKRLPKGQANPIIVANPHDNPIIAQGDAKYIESVLKHDFKNYVIDAKKIELFRRLVEICKQHNILLKAFFCPCKANYWQAVYQQGLEPIFEDLKNQLSAIYPIWDFSGFNAITTEKLISTEPLYFECSHFKPYVGRLILNTLFNHDPESLALGILLKKNLL